MSDKTSMVDTHEEKKVEDPTSTIGRSSTTAGDKEPVADQGANREQTRSKMATTIVIGFFSVIFLCFVYGAVPTNVKIGDLKELVTAVIGSLSGIMGFIIGFYFKNSEN